jgi:hypothetical protein
MNSEIAVEVSNLTKHFGELAKLRWIDEETEQLTLDPSRAIIRGS